MKIKKVKIKNFRSYKAQVEISFGDLTAFVGKNDIGKSTVLEALDIFFNEGKGAVKLDKDDINKQALATDENEIIISVCFDEIPPSIIIDSSNATTLEGEYLLNNEGLFEVIKRYPNAGKEKIFVNAQHPTNGNCEGLLQKKDSELREIISKKGIDCDDRTKNAVMRRAIWDHYITELELKEIEIDVTKGETKSIWEKLQNYLPVYSLFQSDRKNNDEDSEIQDPLKEAVKQILSDGELKQKFSEIATEVETKLNEVAQRTLEKIREMNSDIANSLSPRIPPAQSLKWGDVFKNVSITGDEDIPVNKRGSGVKRLILLNFFRAEVERRRSENPAQSIIYAVEEPETSQHTEHQKILIKAFLELASSPNTQVLITTHSSVLVKALDFQHLRLITVENGEKAIKNVLPNELPYPSLNEVNFLAFGEVTEEYHNELYGYIDQEGELSNYFSGKPTRPYNKAKNDGSIITLQISLTEYIRHQIHHPENANNTKYSHIELGQSIYEMRTFIQTNMV